MLVKILLTMFVISSVFADMTIKQAWEYVKQKDSSIQASKDEVKIAKLKQNSAKGMYLPSITLSGSYTHMDEPIKVEDEIDLTELPIPIPKKYKFEVDLSKQDVFLANLHMLWPLYTGGKIDAMQDVFSAKTAEAKAKLKMQKDKEFLELIKYYYGVVVAKSLYKTRLEAQKALKLHYENAKKLKQNAQIANIELYNAKAKYDMATIEATKAKHKLEIAKDALFMLVGQDDEPSSPLFTNDTTDSEMAYKNSTAQNNVALKILDAKAKQSNALVDIKKSAYKPTVIGHANYNLYKDDSILSETLPKWFAGVIIKIDIFRGIDRAQEIEATKLLSSKVKKTKTKIAQKLEILVSKTYKEMMSAKEEFEALNSSMDLAKENYKLRELSFNEGLSTSLELVEAQTFLESVKTKRLNALYTYVQKLALLCVLSGEREKFFEFSKNMENIE